MLECKIQALIPFDLIAIEDNEWLEKVMVYLLGQSHYDIQDSDLTSCYISYIF